MADQTLSSAPDALPSGPADAASAVPLVTTPALSAQRRTVESVGLPGDGPAPDSAFTWGGYFQAIGILILLLIVLWFGLRVLRRIGGGRFLPATPSGRVCGTLLE